MHERIVLALGFSIATKIILLGIHLQKNVGYNVFRPYNLSVNQAIPYYNKYMFFAFPVVLSKRQFSIFCQIITTLLLIISKRGILLVKFGRDLVLFSDQLGRGLVVVFKLLFRISIQPIQHLKSGGIGDKLRNNDFQMCHHFIF